LATIAGIDHAGTLTSQPYALAGFSDGEGKELLATSIGGMSIDLNDSLGLSEALGGAVTTAFVYVIVEVVLPQPSGNCESRGLRSIAFDVLRETR